MKERWNAITVFVAFVLAAASGIASVAGCVPPIRIAFTSKVIPENAMEIQRLLVLAKFKDDLGEAMSDGFSKTMSDVLAKCGVQSRVVNVGMREALQFRIDQVLTEFTPGAFLEIEPRDGRSYEYGDRLESEHIFQLQVSDFEARKQIWLARAQLGIKESRDEAAGAAFANSIVSRLRDDRVLKGCP